MRAWVIEPGHGSVWLEDATYTDDEGNEDPDGTYVCGFAWYHDSGSNLPDGGIWMPEFLHYQRTLILRVEE